MNETPSWVRPPQVSVLTPAYNSAKFIRHTLDSALSQTFADFEMIVIDDGSTDETRPIVEAYAARDSRIRLVAQSNAGIAAARNRAMAIARGRFFALLDSDDLWLPTYLSEQLEVLSRSPEVAVLSANAINLGGGFDGQPLLPIGDGRTIRFVSLLELVEVEDSLCILSMFRREVVDAIGGFDATLRRSEDYDLWLRAASAGYRIAVNPKPLGLYRRRPDSVSADEVLMLEAMKAPLIKVRHACAERADVVSAVERQLTRVAERSLTASARSALLKGDMPMLRAQLRALELRTGHLRYRIACWLSRILPASLRWAYVCKQRWLQMKRRASYGRPFRWSNPAPESADHAEISRHVVHKMSLEGDVR